MKKIIPHIKDLRLKYKIFGLSWKRAYEVLERVEPLEVGAEGEEWHGVLIFL